MVTVTSNFVHQLSRLTAMKTAFEHLAAALAGFRKSV
jgi:hypothetical protein